MNTQNILNDLLTLVNSFDSTEKLSEFERGQLDGLLWAIDVIKENAPNSSEDEQGA